MRKAALTLVAILAIAILATSCSDADVASKNLSKAADQFEVQRRIVFYNGITGEYIFVIEGLCSLGNNDATGELTVTCKVGKDEAGNGVFKKHYLGLSDNVTFFAEQLEELPADVYRYRVIFKPSAIVPNIDTELPGQ